ncbi:MAG: DUF4398 domain-containing protein [Sulfuricaulis sp.]
MKYFPKHHWYRTISGIGFAAAVIAGCASVPPPTEQIAVSKAAVANATSAGGNEFAPAEMRTAQDELDRAIQAMTAEDYRHAQVLAEQAQVDAQLAAATARSAKARKAAVTVQDDNHVLRKEIEHNDQ